MSRLWFKAAIRRFVLAVALCVLGGAPALAQSTGRVEGIVTDSTGALLPGVTVTATNKGTNVSREATTGADGAYTITPLSLGSYQVKCSLLGFKETTTKLNIAVNQVARLDFKLELGGQAESVEVPGVAPLIDKSTSFIGSVIDRQQVEDLPLNGRNFTQLATLSPGVTRGTPGSVAGGGQSGTDAESFRYAENGGGALSANGLREQFNNFTLDGFDNNESLVNAIAYFPSPEAVQEFRVITTNAPAEFGRAGGAVTSIVTRSGTNELHGSVYEFNRAKGLAATPTFAQEKPDFSQNDFGAALGGPIVKDKTFFFVSYHGLRSKIPVEAGGRVTVPTARMRNGDFSELLNPSFTGLGRPIIIADPETGIPYPGNIIPASQIDSVGRAYLNLYPLPDFTDRAQQNYFTHREKESTFNDFDARIDHNFSAGDTLFVRGSLWRDKFSDPGRIPGFQAGFGAGTSNNRGFNLGVSETHTFSPNLINELRIGYVDFTVEFLPVGFGTDQNAAIGIPGIAGITTANGISLIGGGNGSFIEYLGDFGQYVVEQKAYQLYDAVTWLRARHIVKLGGTLLLRELRFERTRFGKGFYFFSDQSEPSAGRSGYEVSDMLVGTTSFTTTATPGFVPKTTRSWENAIYVQDDFRATHRLTLNLGLRWEVLSPYYEVDDKLANFDPASGTLVLPGANGAPRSTVDTDFNNFGPRIGFAYQVNDKTVFRGGWGLYYSLDRGGIDNQLTENPPATVTEFRFGGPGSAVPLSEPIPLPSQVDPNNPVLPDGSALVFTPRDNPTTRVQQFHVGVQRELTSNTAIMLAYVGTRGSNLTAVLTSAGFSGAISGRLTTVANVGSSNYDSLQVTLRRNLSGGLSYLAGYTLGHARDNTTGPFPGPQSLFLPSDSNDLDKDEGDSNFDVRHRFTFAGTYQLPFARENALLGGWAVNAIVTLAKGTPFTVFSNGRRTNVSGDPNDGPKTAEEWFETSVFSPAPDGQLGNEERNAVRAPGNKTIDLSLIKTFKLGSRAGLELRIEGFNVLNTPQYGFPNQFLGDANFGRITTTRQNSERQVQLAARATF